MSKLNRFSIRNQDGSISLITVLFLTMILSLLTLSSLRLMIREREDSTDVQLTTQAYYAAESGVEDAKKAIEAYLAGNLREEESLNEDVCTPYKGDFAKDLDLSTDEVELDDEGRVAYTCQLIDLEPTFYEKDLGKNESVFLSLIPTSGNPSDVTSVKIEWQKKDPEQEYAIPAANDTSLPAPQNWGEDGKPYPAMLQVGLYSHPLTGANFTRNEITNNMEYFKPTAGLTDGVIGAAGFNSEGAAPRDYNIVNSRSAKCVPESEEVEYICSVEIVNLANLDGDITKNKAFSLFITSLYANSDVRITMKNGSGEELGFKYGQAIVDVTGRAANVFRRVRTVVNIGSSANNVPYYGALTTADSICKVMVETAGGGIDDKCLDAPRN